MIGAGAYRGWRKVHKIAGLAALGWLLVLGLTGFLLDHHEWRWLNQNSVPAAWTSKAIGRLVPATVMRHIAVSEGTIFGASERGAWWSDDRGRRWTKVRFEGLDDQPQTRAIAEIKRDRFSELYLATDDGVWALAADRRSARKVAAQDLHVTSVTLAHDGRNLLGVIDKSRLVKIDIVSGRVRHLPIKAEISGLPKSLPLGRTAMDLHFGVGTFAGRWSLLVNDIAGIALVILSATGIGYWWVTRAGKRKGLSMRSQRSAIRWLYRAHGPVIGLVAAIPILLLAVTAFPMNHIYGFLGWSEERTVARASLPPAFQARTFDGAIDDVVAWPNDPNRIMLATRFGLLETRDGGRTWQADNSVPRADGTAGANLFRVGDRVFAGFGRDNFVKLPDSEAWRPVAGLPSAVTSASRDGEAWYLKNSRGFFTGKDDALGFKDAQISFRHAASGTPMFLFMADVHAGTVFHEQFKWFNDMIAALAVLLVLSGPVIWLRRKWI